MKLEIKNIGAIKEASININGLTVVCGENDTGKSTIGKSLFAIVKGIIGYEEEYGEELYYEVFTRLRQIRILIETHIDLSQLDSEESECIQKYLQIGGFLFFNRSIKNKGLEKNYFQPLIHLLEALSQKEKITDIAYDRLIFYIKDIEDFLLQEPDLNSKKKLALERAFFSEFQSLITNQSIINLLSDSSEQLTIEFSSKFKINKKKLTNLECFNFREITYIETPSVIQFFKLIMSAGVKLPESSRARETVPLHTKDLARKLFNSDKVIANELFSPIHKIIRDSIKGEFAYNNKQKDFFLTRSGNNPIPSMDLASGIKALGIIDILIKNNILNPDDILVLDEPEVNLHPEWQNKYSEIICLLVKLGIKVLVVTHSPYMVSALYHYSKDNDFSHKSFYLSKNGRDGAFFVDKTDDVMGGIVKEFALALEGMY